MSKKPEGDHTSRRDFLKLAGTSVPAAAAVVALAPAMADADVADAGGSGLRETEHTRAYLKAARF